MSGAFSATSERRWLLFLLLLALGLRLLAAVVIDRHVRGEGRTFLVEGDANGYWELGRKLASGEDYCIHSPPRYILRTPGFPLLLAGSMWIVGERVFPVTLLLAGLGTGCCGLTWLMARRLAGPHPALGALFLAAVSPLQIGSSVQVLSEGWFSIWLLLSLLALQPLLRIPDCGAKSHPETCAAPLVRMTVVRMTVRGILAGLAAGAGVLVRPGWILWPVGVAICLLLAGRGDRRTRGLVFLSVCLGCWLVLFPWAWRNHKVCGYWIYTSLWSGPSLYDGLHAGATGASDMRFFDREQLGQRMSEYAVNEEYKRRAWEFAVSEPGRVLELAVVKAGRFLSPVLRAEGFSGGLFSLACCGWYLALVALVVHGSRIMWRSMNWPSLLLLWLPFLLFLLIHLVFVGSIRYRLPAEFPLLVLAGLGLEGFLMRQKT